MILLCMVQTCGHYEYIVNNRNNLMKLLILYLLALPPTICWLAEKFNFPVYTPSFTLFNHSYHLKFLYPSLSLSLQFHNFVFGKRKQQQTVQIQLETEEFQLNWKVCRKCWLRMLLYLVFIGLSVFVHNIFQFKIGFIFTFSLCLCGNVTNQTKNKILHICN